MRTTTFLLPIVLGAVALGAIVVQPARAAPPAIQAKQAEAARVLRQIAAIDERLGVVSERYDGARYRLDNLRAQLGAERVALGRARRQNRTAQLQVARLLVTLYKSGRPTALEAFLGARSISEMLSIAAAEDAISRQDAAVAVAAREARMELEQRVRALQRHRAEAAVAVEQLRRERAQIERGLAQRRALLASVESEVAHLEAQERARQARLAAVARARLEAEAQARARELARAQEQARVKEQALAAARARAVAGSKLAAARAAARRAPAPKTDSVKATPDPPPAVSPDPPPPPPAAAPTITAASLPAAATTVSSSVALPAPVTPVAAPAPVTVLPAGHPEAASVALGYLGTPYVWGGGSPGGFDCSGLVSYVYAQLGIALPHYAAAQWTFGVAVPSSQLQPGDLVFFDSLNHVGIYIGAGQFVHAPQVGTLVRIDSLSEDWYATHYVGARRL